MSEPGYRVGRGFIDGVARINREVEELLPSYTPPAVPVLVQQLAKTGGTAISAATSTKAGTGTVTLYTVDDSDDFITIDDASGTAITQDVKNFNTAASGANTFVWIGQAGNGVWWYLNEACG